MRLIDADAPDLGHCKGGEVCGVVFVRLNDVALAIKNTPTIDPIHAAGGCYCWECKYYSRKPDDSHGQMESFCKKLNRDQTYIRFCGYSERKNGGEESAAD